MFKWKKTVDIYPLRYFFFIIFGNIFSKRDQLIYHNDIGNMGILYTKSLLKSYLTSKKQKNELIGINMIPNANVKELAPYLCDKEFQFITKEICDVADYIVINLSEFNKNGLDYYFEEDNLDNLIKSIQNIRTFELGLNGMLLYQKINKENNSKSKRIRSFSQINQIFPNILIKIDPDLSLELQKKICDLALSNKLDGIIIGEMYKKTKDKNNEYVYEFFENNDMKKIENNALINVFKYLKGYYFIMFNEILFFINIR